MNTAKLVKLTIEGFGDADFGNKLNTKFEAQINPESLSFEFGLLQVNTSNNGSEPSTTSIGAMPQKLSFELVLDGTGVIPGNKINVTKEVENFKKACYYYVGSKHEPPYVQIMWGNHLLRYDKNAYSGQLQTLSIKYTLFDPSGTPLRARLSASFSGTVTPNTKVKIDDQQSPDLTHIFTFKVGDSLPSLCKKVYGDAMFCTEVARFNNLINFRNIQPGTELEFPPLK